jgi:phage-related protein
VKPKSLYFVASSLRDLKKLPEEVRQAFGYALHLAQVGDKHPSAKPLKGFGGGGVVEVVEDAEGGTYRVMYTVKFRGAVFVLHAFQKKSKRGAATPLADMELVRTRLKLAEAAYDAMEQAHGQEPN